MRGRTQTLTLGPFTGGLNTYSDPTSIADNELAECVNLNLDLNGSLVARPSIKAITGTLGNSAKVLCAVFYNLTPTYLVASSAGLHLVRASDNTIWRIIHTHSTATSITTAVQYRNRIYVTTLTGTTANAVGYYNLETEVWTADLTIPGGVEMVAHKGRLFVGGQEGNNSRLYYSGVITAVADFSSGAGGGFFDISPGDGQEIRGLKIYNDDLVVFKRYSTYVVAYDLAIAEAYIRVVNTSIGQVETNCSAHYENSIYVFSGRELYEMSGYNFLKVSSKINFKVGSLPGYTGSYRFVAVINDYVIVHLSGNYYVYNVLTKTWSFWEVNSLRAFGVPFQHRETEQGYVLAGSGTPLAGIQPNTFFSLTTTEPENFSCRIKTKQYTFDDSPHFKKLMYWMTDVDTYGDVTGTLIVDRTEVATTHTLIAPPLRSVLKFLRTARFRTVSFALELSQGADSKVYSLTALINLKQVLSKGVNP